MSEIENFYNEDTLKANINGAAYFILLYEHFEDVVISTVRGFYTNLCVLDGIAYEDIDNLYIKALEKKIEKGENDSPIPYRILLSSACRKRQVYFDEVLKPKENEDKEKDGLKMKGSLRWLQDKGVVSESERCRILAIRKRRCTIVHELFKILGEGLTEDDAKMIGELLSFNRRINNWHFQQIDMPIMEINIPEDTSAEDVIGIDDMTLSAIFRILFCNEGDSFKEALEKAMKSHDSNNDDSQL